MTNFVWIKSVITSVTLQLVLYVRLSEVSSRRNVSFEKQRKKYKIICYPVLLFNYQNIKYESKLDSQSSNSLTQIVCNRTIISFFHLFTTYVYRKHRIITLHGVILCVCVCVCMNIYYTVLYFIVLYYIISHYILHIVISLYRILKYNIKKNWLF